MSLALKQLFIAYPFRSFNSELLSELPARLVQLEKHTEFGAAEANSYTNITKCQSQCRAQSPTSAVMSVVCDIEDKASLIPIIFPGRVKDIRKPLQLLFYWTLSRNPIQWHNHGAYLQWNQPTSHVSILSPIRDLHI